MFLETLFSIEKETENYIYIVDKGTENEMSVTNAVKSVLEQISALGKLGSRRLIYRDSLGNDDEIIHENGRFIRFAPGYKGIDDLFD